MLVKFCTCSIEQRGPRMKDRKQVYESVQPHIAKAYKTKSKAKLSLAISWKLIKTFLSWAHFERESGWQQ